MSEPKNPTLSPATIAAFLAGAGLGVGTTVTITPATDAPDAGPAWACKVLENHDVLCALAEAPPPCAAPAALAVDPDAGTPDASLP